MQPTPREIARRHSAYASSCARFRLLLHPSTHPPTLMPTRSYPRPNGVLILFVAFCCAGVFDGFAQGVVVFTHANVIDGVTERVVEEATVIVRDGRIR